MASATPSLSISQHAAGQLKAWLEQDLTLFAWLFGYQEENQYHILSAAKVMHRTADGFPVLEQEASQFCSFCAAGLGVC